jgi:hypothetical protein
MKWLRQFARFWYDFIVGDDWTIAVAVVLIVACTYALARRWNPWPLIPLTVPAVLAVSVRRASRGRLRKG